MGNDSNPRKLTASATTTLGAVYCYGISINKALTGTVIVNDGLSNKAIFAAATPAGMYHTVPFGATYASLAIALSTTDDVTVFVRVIS